MTILQEDLLEIYNNLTSLSKKTIGENSRPPIKVWYEPQGVGCPLVFEQLGTQVRLRLPVYYCLGLEDLKDGKFSYLLSDDYDYLMTTLQDLIYDQRILDDKTCLSPENYGFDIYAVDLKDFQKGPGILGKIRFVSGTGWLFRTWIKLKWKLK